MKKPKLKLWKEDLDRIKNAKGILDENLNLRYTIPDLSKAVSLNVNKLKTGFKRLTGFTVHEYSLKKKMEKAKELLEKTELPLSEIAMEIGYDNSSSFSVAFKNYYQTNPMSLRTSN